MMLKFCKIFFIAFLIIGGFLVLGAAPGVSASAVCSCGNGSSYTAPDDAITQYGGVNSACEYYCAGSGGVSSAQENDSSGSDNPIGDFNAGSGGQSSVSLPNFLGSGTNSVGGLILKIIDFLIPLAIAFAVFMLVWAGFQFATAQGNDAKLTAAKKNFIWTVVGVAVIVASRAIVSYVTDILGGGTGQGSALITKIEGTLNQIIGLLFVLVTVYFFWGVAEYVRSSAGGESAKLEEGRKHMVWGIIGMTIMLGAWGIVRMITVYFQ